MKQIRTILALLCAAVLWGVCDTDACAQKKITVTGRVLKAGSNEPFMYVHIYVLKDEMTAKAALQQYEINENIGRELFWQDVLQYPPFECSYKEGLTAQGGKYLLEDVLESAWLMFIPYTGKPKIFPVQMDMPDVMLEPEHELPPTTVTAIGSHDLAGKPLQCGDKIYVNEQIKIKKEFLKAYTRLLIFPYYAECSLTGEPVDTTPTYLRPIVAYGSQYRRTQERRFGFDLSRDALYTYRHDTLTLDENDRLRVNFLFKSPDVKKRYVIKTAISYEDFNSEWESRTAFLKYCESNKPMRFLEVNYESAFLDPKDPDFKVIPETKEMNSTGNINLAFLSSTAELDPNNPNNDIEIAKLQDEMLAIENTENNTLSGLTIIGKASPEGPYKRNMILADQRIGFAVGKITEVFNRYTLQRMKIVRTPVVAGWEEVADSMAADSLLPEAEEIRAICKRYEGNMEQQHNSIKMLPYYNKVIKEVYLPKLRTVKYEYKYKEKRALNDAEILQKYEANKHLPARQVYFSRYEYWRLATMLTDSTGLPDIYKRYHEAMVKSKTEDVLAACNYAAYCIREKRCDTLMLKPYIDLRIKRSDVEREDDEKGRVVYNRSAVIKNQVLMYMLAEEYNMALALLERLPDGEEKRTLNAFVHCLACNYDQKEYADIVAQTSAVNQVVIALANNKLNFASTIVEEEMSKSDPRRPYFLAQIERKKNSTEKDRTAQFLLECFKLDESYMDIARDDASFVDDITGEKPCFDKAEDDYWKWREEQKK